MSYLNQGIRKFGIAAVAAVAFGVSPSAANAGFFDQLFGGAPEPSQPSYSYEPQQPASPDLGAPMGRPRQKKKIVVREVVPVRQKTTDLMHDKTLHQGDAIMMKDGLHIYSGGEAVTHTAKQFVPIDSARSLPSSKRAALVAMDTTRNDPLKKGHSPDTLASGRSAAVGVPISKGFKITDARGISVRYVGP